MDMNVDKMFFYIIFYTISVMLLWDTLLVGILELETCMLDGPLNFSLGKWMRLNIVACKPFGFKLLYLLS